MNIRKIRKIIREEIRGVQLNEGGRLASKPLPGNKAMQLIKKHGYIVADSGLARRSGGRSRLTIFDMVKTRDSKAVLNFLLRHVGLYAYEEYKRRGIEFLADEFNGLPISSDTHNELDAYDYIIAYHEPYEEDPFLGGYGKGGIIAMTDEVMNDLQSRR